VSLIKVAQLAQRRHEEKYLKENPQ
jgi:hypothetical protein